jgi:hypothetical protein
MNRFAFFLLLSIVWIVPPEQSTAQAPPILLQKCYGGSGLDNISCIRETSDAGYIAAGTTLSTDGDLAGNGGITGMWVLKLDAFGNIQWEKTFPYNHASHIEQTFDRGYIVTGSTTFKLHSDGSIDWQYDVPGVAIHQTADSGYVMCNVTGGSTPEVAKLDKNGLVQWQKMYNTPDTLFSIDDILPSNSGGYVITGGYYYDIFGSTAFVCKTDNVGNLLLPVQYIDNHAHGEQIIKTPDGKYVVVASKPGYGIIAKFDDACNVAWDREISDNNLYSAAVTHDAAYVACGDTSLSGNADFLIKKFDANGQVIWKKTMGGSMSESGYSITQNNNGNYAVAGITQSNDGDVSGNHGGQDGWVVIFGTNLGLPPAAITSNDINVYPVPALQTVQIALLGGYENATLQLRDMYGKVMQVAFSGIGLTRELKLDIIPKGVYLLEVANYGIIVSKKVVHY